jgi:hypothetical protein
MRPAKESTSLSPSIPLPPVPTRSAAARARSAALVLGLLPLALAPACTCGGAGTEPSAASASAPSSVAAPLASASASGGADEQVRPVYPTLTGPADPVAVKICGLMYTEGERRAAECCGRKPGKSGLERECERALTGALAGKFVRVNDDEIAACAAALQSSLTGCDWVTPTGAPPLPAVCTRLLTGQVPLRATCRSHLECVTGSFCEGLSPTRVGTCSKPRLDGSCFGGADSLATLARQRTTDDHPACDGVCIGQRCTEAVALGGTCKLSTDCGKGHHCEGGTCKDGAANDCSACPAGTSCVGGSCRAPKKAGETCAVDAECRGACVKPRAPARPGQVGPKPAASGTCAMQCSFTWPTK